MNKENLNNIVGTLKLRMNDYDKTSDAYKELNNTINMLTAKCYQEETVEPIKSIEDIMEELLVAALEFGNDNIELLMSCEEDSFYIYNISTNSVIGETYLMNNYNRYDLKEACEERGLIYKENTN